MNTCFESFKDIHLNETIYIIGNGPSLSKTDLSLIENKPSIAMNRISLLYPKFINWRPSYYIFCSSNINNPIWGTQWANSVKAALSEQKTISFIDKSCKAYLLKDKFLFHKHVYTINSLTEERPLKVGDINPKSFSTNIIHSIDKSGSTINLALQLAYFMGASNIVFIGTDLGWTANNGRKKDTNHFDSSYRAHIPDPVKANIQMRNVHILANKVFSRDKPGVKLYNASKLSKLDTYPIIDYELFANEGKIVENKELNKKAKEYWVKLKPGNKYLIRLRHYIYRIKEKLSLMKI